LAAHQGLLDVCFLCRRLSRFIEAIGGEMKIVALCADHAVTIKNISDLSEKPPV
jgi:hypothetical protein